MFGKSILILFAEMDFLRRGGLFEVETLLSIIKDAIRPHPDKQYQRLKLPAPPYRRVQTGNICSPRLCALVFFPNASAATSAAAHAAAAAIATATSDVFPDTKRTQSQTLSPVSPQSSDPVASLSPSLSRAPESPHKAHITAHMLAAC